MLAGPMLKGLITPIQSGLARIDAFILLLSVADGVILTVNLHFRGSAVTIPGYDLCGLGGGGTSRRNYRDDRKRLGRSPNLGPLSLRLKRRLD